MTNLTIPDSISKIKSHTFSGCSSLTSVIVPDGVTEIDEYAFSGCENLSDVTLATTLNTIGFAAFHSCKSLESIDIPSNVTTIGSVAFCNCYKLNTVICRPIIPPSLDGTSVFYNNFSDRKIYVPSKSVDTYKTDGSWSGYANYIFSMPGDDVECLSQEGTANCYIVSRLGSYEFNPTKGNSSESVGEISSAEVLWESFGTDVTPDVGGLVKNVKYADGAISFETSSTFKEGNAVIAAKDASGNILWSWHIWLTDQPEEQVYYNNAGTMMDRNLGATSATPGDVGALGLHYQWGRKDPFLGSSSISSSTLAKSTITWPSAVSSDSSNGTIAFATANPTTFITDNDSNYDWYYTGSSSTDNTRWTTSESSKSIYDPCPAGWRVPDGGDNGVWSKALGSSSYFEYTYSSSNEGMNFSGKFGSASTIWYPASGYRNDFDGVLYGVGNNVYYWSASPYDRGAYNLYFSSAGSVLPSNDYHRSNGYSVRCLQE